MACSGFIYYAAHDWNTRVKSMSDHPSYREHTRNAARTWADLSNLEQAYWDQKSARTDACREKIRLKSMTEEEKKALLSDLSAYDMSQLDVYQLKEL